MKLNVDTILFVCLLSINACCAGQSGWLITSATSTVSMKQQSPAPIQYLTDHCQDAKAGAAKATNFCRNILFIRAKDSIRWMASDGREHAVAFGKDTSGNVISSTISTGNANSSTLGTVPGKFADLHNHPNNAPPSSGDIYALIDNASANNSFETRYIVTRNGTVYALVVTDLRQAKDFNTRYARVPNPGYQPRFPEVIVETIIDMKGKYDLTEELAMAYLLEHYQMGIALLKQDANGNFVVLNMDEAKNDDGTITYVVNNCQ